MVHLPKRHRRAWLLALALPALAACDADGDGIRARNDCDDRNPSRYPGGTEICDDQDNDCDDVVDERLGRDWFRDLDDDGYGEEAATARACNQPEGYASRLGDCDDDEPTVFPNASERCDGLDNNCNGFVDVDRDYAVLYYRDADGDGAGDRFGGVLQCAEGPSLAANDDDCDDSNAAIAPGAPEACNGIDDDCDGQIDEECP